MRAAPTAAWSASRTPSAGCSCLCERAQRPRQHGAHCARRLRVIAARADTELHCVCQVPSASHMGDREVQKAPGYRAASGRGCVNACSDLGRMHRITDAICTMQLRVCAQGRSPSSQHSDFDQSRHLPVRPLEGFEVSGQGPGRTTDAADATELQMPWVVHCNRNHRYALLASTHKSHQAWARTTQLVLVHSGRLQLDLLHLQSKRLCKLELHPQSATSNNA